MLSERKLMRINREKRNSSKTGFLHHYCSDIEAHMTNRVFDLTVIE